MQQPDTRQLQLVHLSAEPVLMRIYLHPGMRDYFMQAGKPKKTSALIRKILGDYFFNNVPPEEIRAFIEPYEQGGLNLFGSPGGSSASGTTTGGCS